MSDLEGDSSPPPPPDNPFSTSVDLLSPFIESSSTSSSTTAIDRRIVRLRDWCIKLSNEYPSPSRSTLDPFLTFLSTELLDFDLDSASSFSPGQPNPASSTSTSHEPPFHSPPQPLNSSQLGKKASHIVKVLRLLLEGPNERAKKDGEWWYEVGLAITQGLTLHLDKNTFGKKTAQDLAYRTFLCYELAEPLVRVVVPDVTDLPTSSGDEMGGLGKNQKEMALKYQALEVVGEMLSKNENNKSIVRRIYPAEHLGRLLHTAFDYHLSLFVFELAYRLMPTARDPEAYNVYISSLWSEDIYGNDKARALTEEFRKISVNDWEACVERIMSKISSMHIRRSQGFRTLSMTYNGQQLLVPADREKAEDSPTDLQVARGEYYDPVTLWISRHILAAVVVVDQGTEIGETMQRLVVPLEGIEKFYAQHVNSELDVLRLTILISPSHPLTLNAKPHPSSPSRPGLDLEVISETLMSEYDAAHQDVSRYHELVVLIPATSINYQILKTTLEHRGRENSYPKLLTEIPDFPHIAPRLAKVGPQTSLPAPRPPATTSTSNIKAPAAFAESLTHRTTGRDRKGELQQQEKRVQFVPSPTESQGGRKRKSSEAEKPIEGTFRGKKRDEEGEKAPVPERSESSSRRGGGEEGKGKETIFEEEEEDEHRLRESQELAKRRREEVATLAGLEGKDGDRITGDSRNHEPQEPMRKKSRIDVVPAQVEHDSIENPDTESSERFPPREKVTIPRAPSPQRLQIVQSTSTTSVDPSKAANVSRQAGSSKNVPPPSDDPLLIQAAQQATISTTAPVHSVAQSGRKDPVEAPSPSKTKHDRTRGQEKAGAGDESSDLSEPVSVASRPFRRESVQQRKVQDEQEKAGANEKAKEKKVEPKSKEDNVDLPPVPKKVTSKYASRGRASKGRSEVKAVEDEEDSEVDEEEQDGVEVEVEQQSKSRGRRGRPSRATALQSRKKKVVSPPQRKVARESTVKTKKRVRSSTTPEPSDRSSEQEEDEDEPSTGSDDLPDPDDLGKKTKTIKKKVVPKPKSKKPLSKRRKVEPKKPSNEDDEDDESGGTDYDTYPGNSLEQKKYAVNASKRYGKGKKETPKIVGSTRKAGARKSRTKRVETEAAETDYEQEREEQPSRKAKTTRKAVKGVETEDGASDDENDEDFEKGTEGRRSTKKVVTEKKVSPKKGRSTRSAQRTSAPPAVLPDKRVSRDIPPPADVQGIPLASKPRPPPSVTDTTSSRPRKSFSELVKLPNDDDNESRRDVIDRDAHEATHEGEQDLGGFEHTFFNYGDDLPQATTQGVTAEQNGAAPIVEAPSHLARPHLARSLSPVIDPAKADLAYVENLLDRQDRSIGRPQPEPPVRAPTVLVEDSPSPSAAKPEVADRRGDYLGDHRIASQRLEESQDDVEMALEEQRGDEAAEEVADEDRAGVADDSGIHFDIPIDKGIEGGEERSVQDEREYYDNQHEPEDSTAPLIPHPVPQPVAPRPFLVQRPAAAPVNRRALPSAQSQQQQASRQAAIPAITPPRPLPFVQPLRSARQDAVPATTASHQRLGARLISIVQQSQQQTARQRRPVSASLHRQSATQHPPPPAAVHFAPRPASRPSHSRQSIAHHPHLTSAGRGSSRSARRMPSSSPSLDDDSLGGGQDGESELDDDFDDDDLVVHETFQNLANIMARKNRQKRWEREAHTASSIARVEEPLNKFLNMALSQTAEIIESARAYAAPPPVGARDSTRDLLAVVEETKRNSQALWNEIQKELERFEGGGAAALRDDLNTVPRSGGLSRGGAASSTGTRV